MTGTIDDGLQLPTGFGGDALAPGDAGYDEARTVFNAMVDRRPALIARCASRDDVVSALRLANERDWEIAVRAGGHSVAGHSVSEGGLVIDLRQLCEVTVDPQTRTARVGGGATWGHVDRACQPYGLATTGGRVSTTGVAGLTLGGGSGWIERKFGLACDNLLSAELVTVDGRVVTASEQENPELFWALHGGGGNFGVVTELTFRLHPLPESTLALLLWPTDVGPEVVRRYRNLIENEAPDELGGGCVYLTAPPEEFVPPHLVGRLVLAVAAVYAGGEGEARDAIAPLLGLGPDAAMVAQLPYAEVQSALDDPPGYRNYWSAEHLAALPDSAVDGFCARAGDMIVPSPSQHALLPWGGAVARGRDDWPLPYRHTSWVVHPLGLWSDPDDDERAIAWARATCADMRPYSTGDVYLNFVGDEGADRVAAGVGMENYLRLALVKREYDPDNRLRLNHNIAPADSAESV